MSSCCFLPLRYQTPSSTRLAQGASVIPAAPGGNLAVAVGLGQLHAGPAVEAQPGGQFGHDGERVAAPQFVLPPCGVGLKAGGDAGVRD